MFKHIHTIIIILQGITIFSITVSIGIMLGTILVLIGKGV